MRYYATKATSQWQVGVGQRLPRNLQMSKFLP